MDKNQVLVPTLVGYARVSTGEQQPDLQVDELLRAGCGRIFSDTASGSAVERPELTAALNHLRDGDVLVLWRLDRWGRSFKHLVQVIGDLEDRGVGFRSLHEHIDTTTPTGRLVFRIFGALAEFERDLTRERTSAWPRRCPRQRPSGGSKTSPDS